MMSDYDDKEESIEDGSPYEIYEFIGTYRSYYMTSDALSHDFEGHSYTPVPGLKRSSLKAGTHEEDNIDLTVVIPITEQIVKDYGFQTTPPALDLTIYRFQRDALTFVAYWKGPVASITIDDEYATLRTPSKFGNILQGNIPNIYVQPPCNNVLFDELCRVSRAANSLTTTVSLVEGVNITIPSISPFVDGWFIGGEIAVPARNERRMIIAQAGPVLTVNYAFSRLGPGTSIQVTAGCDHSFTGANGCPKFNNQINYGGCPYVPGESNNPFTNGVR
ncbi:hypothetical protein [Pseudomonas phage KP1]|uniref:Bacteriophage phiJL001 Gp84 C-terminal domain-containing protein n=1 Tax=Pseudomonas phage KP1 TaxID=2562463 RepID=A0A6G5QAT2_9CAUD|nr:tail assembly protein [Pseudomonas phage KP1]QBZ71732.1 hypothetical protein [Pseudomonas phage KP1]